MTFAADFLKLDLLTLPWHSGRLGAGLYRGVGNNSKPLLLLAPGAGNSVEPHVRYAVGLELTLADGMVVQDLGQLVVTSDRIIGMVTNGWPARSRWTPRRGRSTSSRPAWMACSAPRSSRSGGAFLAERSSGRGTASRRSSNYGSNPCWGAWTTTGG